jgi:WD40 repeat protein
MLSMTSLAFSADAKWLACACEDGSVRVWNMEEQVLVRSLHGHIAPAWCVAFHPQLPILASGSLDGTIKVWDVTTGVCEAMLRAERPYEGMNITGATGLTDTERSTLIALGAVDGN